MNEMKTIVIPDVLITVQDNAFSYCDALEKVYYLGTESEWDEINIIAPNYALTSAVRYYYSETRPEKEGNYWHYAANGTTILEW